MLDVEKLTERAQELVQEYKKLNKNAALTKRGMIEAYEARHGPLVIVPHRYQYSDAYLIPIEGDAGPFLDTKTAPGEDRLTPWKINAQVLPTAAKLQSVLYNIKGDTPVSTNSDTHTHTPSSSISAQDEPAPLPFSFCIDDTTAVEETEVESVAETSHDTIGSTSQHELRTKDDLKTFVKKCAGLSIVAEEATRRKENENEDKPSFHTIGFTDLQRKKLNVPILQTDSGAIRDLVKQNTLNATRLDDRKDKAKNEKLRKHNELDGWFGMKRQQITPEIRAELKAIDLRGFTDPKRRYRGTKRQLALSKAESGFFQMGVVMNGGIEDSGVSAEGLMRPDTKRKRTRTLITSILKASGI